jgi:hypothetical protein
MFTLEITTLDGQQTVELPSGWHEVSYTYYKERIAPYAQPEEDVVKNNVRLVCSMLGINASEANVMEFSAILGNLMMWMEEVPQVKEFWHNDVMYQLPILGKAQAGDKPFMTVGDWENANDANGRTSIWMQYFPPRFFFFCSITHSRRISSIL